MANRLAEFFRKVEATDISSSQIKNAAKASNIFYSEQPAENTNFNNHYFDLVTVAQAIHWFDFSEFYKEVNRVLKPGGIIAVIGYSLFQSNEAFDKIINDFYHHIIGPYWDPERKYLDEAYKTIPFPFEAIKVPDVELKLRWSIEHLIGYLKTWSAVKHFEKANSYNPVDRISQNLRQAFGEHGEVRFPLLLRAGRR